MSDPYLAQIAEKENSNVVMTAFGEPLPLKNLLHSMAQTTNALAPTMKNGEKNPKAVLKSSLPSSSPAGQSYVYRDASSERTSGYRDFSQVPADESEAFFVRAQIVVGDEPRGTNFPTKLNDMLSREEFSDVICCRLMVDRG